MSGNEAIAPTRPPREGRAGMLSGSGSSQARDAAGSSKATGRGGRNGREAVNPALYAYRPAVTVLFPLPMTWLLRVQLPGFRG